MAEKVVDKKKRETPVRRSTMLDTAELRVIGIFGRELDQLSHEGQVRVISYFTSILPIKNEQDV